MSNIENDTSLPPISDTLGFHILNKQEELIGKYPDFAEQIKKLTASVAKTVNDFIDGHERDLPLNSDSLTPLCKAVDETASALDFPSELSDEIASFRQQILKACLNERIHWDKIDTTSEVALLSKYYSQMVRFFKEKRYDEVLKICLQIEDIQHNDPKLAVLIRVNKASALSELGRHEEALQAFEEAEKMDYSNPEFEAKIRRNKATVLSKLGRREEATEAYLSVLDVFGITMKELQQPHILFETEKGKRFLQTDVGKSYAQEFVPEYLPGTKAYKKRQLMEKLGRLQSGDVQPGDDVFSPEEMDLLKSSGAAVPVEVKGKGAGVYSAQQREFVVDGKVAGMMLELNPNPGVTPIANEFSASMSLEGLGKPAFLQQIFETAPDNLKQLHPATLVQLINRQFGVEVSEKAVLEVARNKWEDYEAGFKAAILENAFNAELADILKLLPPTQIANLINKFLGTKLNEDEILKAAKNRWEDYESLHEDSEKTGNWEPAFLQQGFFKTAPDELKQMNPAEIVDIIKEELGIEVSEDTVSAAAKNKWGDYESWHEDLGEDEE